MQWLSQDLEIEPFTERMYCEFITYDGPDVGVNLVQTLQTNRGGHHAVVMVSNADPEMYPDGSLHDCTEDDSLVMADLEPLHIGEIVEHDEEDGLIETKMDLPEGMAVFLESGTRLVLQSHFVNYEAKPILVQDVVNLHFIPEEEVETWAASWVHIDSDFNIEPNSKGSTEADCGWESEFYLLSVTGHMHEYGTSFYVDHYSADGDSNRLYEIENWLPEMRDNPPVQAWEPDAFQVKPGDHFITHCDWDNTTDHVLNFPEEMCVSVGMAYPAKLPMICEGTSE